MGWVDRVRNSVLTMVVAILRVYATRADADSATVTYVGTAAPGTTDAAEAWRIMKIDTSVIILDIKWAGGSDAFDKAWTHRKDGTYVYS